MEELQARHRKELRDLIARTTHKKKQASKKTRKGVNDECDQLERELRDLQARELAEFAGDSHDTEDVAPVPPPTNGIGAMRLENDGDLPDEPPQEATSCQNQGQGENPSSRHDPIEPKKPNRAKARLAKRAAEQEALRAEGAAEAASMPDEKEVERKRMLEAFKERGLVEKVIRADGHCLYSAVADQLQVQALSLKPRLALVTLPGEGGEAGGEGGEEMPAYRVVRHAAASYIQSHPDEFTAFLEEPLPDYLRKIRETGEWGGQLELLALAKIYRVDINVLQGTGRTEKIEGAAHADGEEVRNIWLAYYRHGFGLGEHYNSLRKTP